MAYVDIGRLAALEPGWQETWSLLYANLLSEVQAEARRVVDPTDSDQLQAFLAGSWLAFHSIRRELLAGRLPALTRPSTRPTASTRGASRPRAHTRGSKGERTMNCEDGCQWQAVLLEGSNTVFNSGLNAPN